MFTRETIGQVHRWRRSTSCLLCVGPLSRGCVLHSGNVGEVLDSKDERGQNAQLLKDLDLEQVLDRNVENLSGGVLQKTMAVVAVQSSVVLYRRCACLDVLGS